MKITVYIKNGTTEKVFTDASYDYTGNFLIIKYKTKHIIFKLDEVSSVDFEN